MIIKWQATNGYTEIEPVECTRETENHVFRMIDVVYQPAPVEIILRKNSYFTAYEVGYFNTWAEAHAHLTRYAQKLTLSANQSVTMASKYTEGLKSLSEPVKVEND